MSLWAALWLIATTANVGGVQVDSELDCPDSPSVASRLGSMVAAADFPGYRLRISARPPVGAEPNVLTLRLADAQGIVVGERDWQRSEDCRAAAAEVAVVAATWLIALPPPVRAALPLPHTDRAAVAIAVPAKVVAPQPAARDRRRNLALGLGTGLVFTPDGQTVPAAMLRAEVSPAGVPRIVCSLGFIAAGSWQRPLEEGQVSWRRWVGVIELGIRQTWGRLALGSSAGIEAGALSFRGLAFSRPQSRLEPDVAARATVRAALALGGGGLAPRIWVAARLSAGLLRYKAGIEGSNTRVAVSSVQAGPWLGVDFPLPL